MGHLMPAHQELMLTFTSLQSQTAFSFPLQKLTVLCSSITQSPDCNVKTNPWGRTTAVHHTKTRPPEAPDGPAASPAMAQGTPGRKYEHFLVSFPVRFVAHVEINRPAKLNAFSRPVWLEFGALFARLSEDAEVRAIVLSGAGDRAFTAGLDVQAVGQDSLLTAAGDPARQAAPLRRHIDEFQACIGRMEKCEKRKLRAAAVCISLERLSTRAIW